MVSTIRSKRVHSDNLLNFIANLYHASDYIRYYTSSVGKNGSYHGFYQVFYPITHILCIWYNKSTNFNSWDLRNSSVIIWLSTICFVAFSKSNGNASSTYDYFNLYIRLIIYPVTITINNSMYDRIPIIEPIKLNININASH